MWALALEERDAVHHLLEGRFHHPHDSTDPPLPMNPGFQGFSKPTEIQRQCLPAAVRDRLDIIGAAQTGSGKTLVCGHVHV